VLDRHRVDYVLVGGAAAAMLGAQRLTQDVDCVISRKLENLERVAAALGELDARLRVAGMSDEEARALNVQLDVHSLQRMGNSTWTTDAGQFDILSDLKNEAGGLIPYEVLVTRSSVVAVDGYQVHVAAVSDVIAAKTFANRAKDLEALPELMVIESEVEPRPPSARFISEPHIGGADVELPFEPEL
jgi:hypothetical protein